jgi:uncharacterized protein YtpQ (UPF0354 family)
MNDFARNLLIGTIAVFFTIVHVKSEHNHYNNQIAKLVIEREKQYKKQNIDIPEAVVLCEAVSDIIAEKVDYLNEKIELLEKRIKKIEKQKFLL